MKEQLFNEPYRFGFFQAVRMLERLFPERQPVGQDALPSTEVVRFRTRVSLDFPASEIHELQAASEAGPDRPPEMQVSFLGLTGPMGVLPAPYTELLQERTRYKDRTLWDFLDLFNHRLISLFYRAWEKHHFPFEYERGRESRFTEYLFALVGMGTGGLRERFSFFEEGILSYAGLIAQKPHSVVAIEYILQDYFQVPVHIQQYVAQNHDLDEGSLTRLGAANCTLGKDAVAGCRVRERQSKFRVRFGPCSFEQYSDFLPTGASYRQAIELVRLLAGTEHEFDFLLILKAAEVPYCQLLSGREGTARIGWTSWVRTRAYTRGNPEVVLPVEDRL